MTQTANNYGQVLYELSISQNIISETEEIFRTVPQVTQALCSPVVPMESKHRIIEKVFPSEIQNFIKVLCNYHHCDQIDEIFAAYKDYYNRQNSILTAVLYYVTAPEEEQLAKIKAFLSKKYKKTSVEITLVEEPSLIGGFIIRTGDKEYDYSIKGRLQSLKQKMNGR